MFRRIELPSSSGSSGPRTRRQLFISRRGATSQKIRTFISTAVRTSVSQEEVPAVKEKGREDKNRKRKIFRRPEGRLVLVVLLLMRTMLMIRINRNKFLIIKPTRCTISQIYFWYRTLHVSDRFSVHHQESSTVHIAIGICHTGYADCLLAVRQAVSITCMTYTYCCVYSTRLLMMDRKPARNM